MKKAISFALALILIVSAAVLAGCYHRPVREVGDIDVDYGMLVKDGGTIMNVKYEDDTPVSFMYPNYFTRSSDPEDAFVAKGPDDNSVLMYKLSDLSESRSYDMIAAYSDEEAKNWVEGIQLGLVESQGVQSITVNDFEFKKLADHIVIKYDGVAVYNTGLRQHNSIIDFILPSGKLYTVTSFAPESAVEKYGPLFSDMQFNGQALDAELGDDGRAEFDNGTIAFSHSDAFSITDENGTLIAMAPEKFALLGGAAGTLKDGRTYDELLAMSEEDLLRYLSSLTGLEVTEADKASVTEENGRLRLEAKYRNSAATAAELYCVVTQFVEKDGSTYLLFAYMNEPEPISDIRYNG